MPSGQTGSQPPQMGQNMQEGQFPGMTSEGGQGQMPSGQAGSQPPRMGQGTQGGMPGFEQGGRQGGPPGGKGPGGPGGGKWYKISLRSVGPYACLLAFFILITCVIDGGVKRFSRSKRESVNNAA